MGDIAYSRQVTVPFSNCPYSWISVAHKPGTNIKGEMGLYLFLAHKVKNDVKGGSPRLRSKKTK